MDVDEALRPSWIEIDLDALAHNVEQIRRQIGPSVRIIAALKGDAYGHGIGPVARRLQDCGVFSIATGQFRDALAAREAGVGLPILMFAGALAAGIPRLLEHGIIPTVHDWDSALAVNDAATGPTPVYLKVDIGLGRLGVPVDDALAFIRRLRQLPHLVVDGIYTHLTFDDDAGRERARGRYAAFDTLLAAVDAEGIEVPVTQALASSALRAGLSSRANAVCPGSMLYGIPPLPSEYRPVVTSIKSRLIHVGAHGEHGLVGVVPIGLADGYVKTLPNTSPQALLHGRRVPIRGVSLEYITLALSESDRAQTGDEVVLLGRSGDEQITLDEMAAWQGLAPHAALMSFEGRLPARYSGG